jgi:hypothetical protein
MFVGFAGESNKSLPEGGLAGQLFMRMGIRMEVRGAQASFADIPAALAFGSASGAADAGGST